MRGETEARTALQQSLRKGTSPDGKATFPRLLGRASGLTEELYLWVEDELAKQVTLEVGFDRIDGPVRSVPLCLFDVLDVAINRAQLDSSEVKKCGPRATSSTSSMTSSPRFQRNVVSRS